MINLFSDEVVGAARHAEVPGTAMDDRASQVYTSRCMLQVKKTIDGEFRFGHLGPAASVPYGRRGAEVRRGASA